MIWNQIVKVTLIMKLIYIHFAFAIFAFEVTLLDFLLPIKAVIFIYFWAEVWWWQEASCNNPTSTITRTVFFTSNISSRRISDPYRWTLKSTMSDQVFKKSGEETKCSNLNFSNSYTFPCAFTRGSNYYVRPTLVK